MSEEKALIRTQPGGSKLPALRMREMTFRSSVASQSITYVKTLDYNKVFSPERPENLRLGQCKAHPSNSVILKIGLSLGRATVFFTFFAAHISAQQPTPSRDVSSIARHRPDIL